MVKLKLQGAAAQIVPELVEPVAPPAEARPQFVAVPIEEPAGHLTQMEPALDDPSNIDRPTYASVVKSWLQADDSQGPAQIVPALELAEPVTSPAGTRPEFVAVPIELPVAFGPHDATQMEPPLVHASNIERPSYAAVVKSWPQADDSQGPAQIVPALELAEPVASPADTRPEFVSVPIEEPAGFRPHDEIQMEPALDNASNIDRPSYAAVVKLRLQGPEAQIVPELAEHVAPPADERPQFVAVPIEEPAGFGPHDEPQMEPSLDDPSGTDTSSYAPEEAQIVAPRAEPVARPAQPRPQVIEVVEEVVEEEPIGLRAIEDTRMEPMPERAAEPDPEPGHPPNEGVSDEESGSSGWQPDPAKIAWHASEMRRLYPCLCKDITDAELRERLTAISIAVHEGRKAQRAEAGKDPGPTKNTWGNWLRCCCPRWCKRKQQKSAPPAVHQKQIKAAAASKSRIPPLHDQPVNCDATEIARYCTLSFMYLRHKLLDPCTLARDAKLQVLSETHKNAVAWGYYAYGMMARKQPNIVQMDGATVIIADLHGSLPQAIVDLMKYYHDCIKHPGLKLLVLGDVVDRGAASHETMLLFMSLAVLDPKIVIIRGNHESADINAKYGFRHESYARFGNDLGHQIYTHANWAFRQMPLAAVVQGRIFAMHGFIDPDSKTLEEYNKIDRFSRERPRAMTSLMWNDPHTGIIGCKHNERRGGAYQVGPNVVYHFMEGNQFDLILRGHQAPMAGHEWYMGISVCTCFGKPDYDQTGNFGCYVLVDEESCVHFTLFAGDLSQPMPSEECVKKMYRTAQHFTVHGDQTMNEQLIQFLKTPKTWIKTISDAIGSRKKIHEVLKKYGDRPVPPLPAELCPDDVDHRC
ncbi:unnamed protein product, partial [Mesorhabditis spiculigera]